MSISYGSMTLRERITEVDRKRRSLRNEERSQDGFENSNDSESKKRKQISGRGGKFDSRGVHKETGRDLCDCLVVECPGCFMPCPKCSSTKCGHECRKNRRWLYENIEIEGTSLVIKNPSKK